jgi:hypothetical protein
MLVGPLPVAPLPSETSLCGWSPIEDTEADSRGLLRLFPPRNTLLSGPDGGRVEAAIITDLSSSTSPPRASFRAIVKSPRSAPLLARLELCCDASFVPRWSASKKLWSPRSNRILFGPGESPGVVSASLSPSSTSPEGPTGYLRTLSASLPFEEMVALEIFFSRVPSMNFVDLHISFSF